MKAMEGQLTQKEKAFKEMKKEMDSLRNEVKSGQRDLKDTKEEFGRQLGSLADRMAKMETRADHREAREHVPCTDTASDVDTSDAVAASHPQSGSSFSLPPIRMNFPPQKK